MASPKGRSGFILDDFLGNLSVVEGGEPVLGAPTAVGGNVAQRIPTEF